MKHKGIKIQNHVDSITLAAPEEPLDWDEIDGDE